jgi:hypothetical protein
MHAGGAPVTSTIRPPTRLGNSASASASVSRRSWSYLVTSTGRGSDAKLSDDQTTELMADLALGATKEALRAAQRKLRPSPLDLVFDRSLSGCVHTGPVYDAATGARMRAEWIRVGVNNSGGGVEGVRVQALNLKPDMLGTLPVQLHRMHDNPQGGQPYEQSFAVPASKSPVVFIDVVSHPEGAPSFQLLHVVREIEPWFPVGTYELTLVVTGEGIKPRERTFSLALAHDRIEFARLR